MVGGDDEGGAGQVHAGRQPGQAVVDALDHLLVHLRCAAAPVAGIVGAGEVHQQKRRRLRALEKTQRRGQNPIILFCHGRRIGVGVGRDGEEAVITSRSPP